MTQLRGGDPGHAQHLVEAPALPPFECDVNRKQRADRLQRHGAEILQAADQALDLSVEQHPERNRRGYPERRAGAVQKQIRAPPDTHRSGERRSDGSETGNEFTQGEGDPAPAIEVAFGLANA